MQARLAMNSWSSCFCFRSVGIPVKSQQAQLWY
jgi:hypothetical protein